jgi:hypothetical protein
MTEPMSGVPVPLILRSVRRAVGLVVVLAASAVLAGCGPGTRPASTPTPGDVAPRSLVMVIRHGEKPDGTSPGVDANGATDDSSLTSVGWERAHRLVDLFDPTDGPLRPGLGRPTAIYAAAANDDGEGLRTRETVGPLAEQLGIPVNTGFGKGDEEKLVEHVIAQPGPTLICWQHGEIPAIAEAFPGVTPTPPSQWPGDRFDVVWTFTRTPDGWHFAQLPELALPGDNDATVGN